MFPQRDSGKKTHYSTGIAATLASMVALMCLPASAQDKDTGAEEAIEEIVVRGEKSIVNLQRALYQAEENMFDTFNALNSNDMFDIKCEFVVYLGSRRRHHVCTPKFARRIRADEATELARVAGGRSEYVSPRVRKLNELLWQEMATLVAEYPELLDAYSELAKASQELEVERERRRNE